MSQHPRQHAKKPTHVPSDVLSHAYCYRLRRDALFIAAQTKPVADNRFLHWIQARLLDALYHDPAVPAEVKPALADFHAKTTLNVLQDRRGERRRNRLAQEETHP